jgi:hypothetical protein
MVVAYSAADAQKPAIRVCRDINVPDLIALEHGSEEILEPILDPLERCSEQDSGGRKGKFFRVENSLGTETTSDIRSYEADLVFRQSQHVDQHRLAAVGHLRAAPDSQKVGGLVEASNHAAPFERMPPALVDAERLGKTWLARAKALAGSPYFTTLCATRLSGQSSRALGDPGFSAVATSTTAGKGSYSTITAAAASSARARLRATTSATGSPT